MKLFFKNFSLYLGVIILLFTGIILFSNDFLIEKYRFTNKVFFKKVSYFSDFIKQKDNVNLILGSSVIEDAIIPDSLGGKWFSFTNEFQNIYESYKFLDYYKDSIKIDTILIGITPFDFPKSFVNHYSTDGRSLNGGFYIFGEDSITTLKRERNKISIKKKIQLIKDEYFFNINQLIKIITNQNFNFLYAVWSKQGFSGRINATSRDLDKLFIEFSQGKDMPGSLFNRHNQYFKDVQSDPNFYYFNLFHSLSKSLDIETIYLLTPKSKYYHRALNQKGFDKIMDEILDGIKIKEATLWNYEKLETDTFGFHFFWDETHITHDAAKVFSKVIDKQF